MKALILAAGYGTRLYPLTHQYPKPLLKIGKRPLIDFIIDKIKDLEQPNEIIVVTNQRFIKIFRKWLKTKKDIQNLSLVNDLTKDYQHRRGAIGDIDFVIRKKQIKDDLLVIGADNLFEGNLKDFIYFAKKKSPYVTIGVYDIKDKNKASLYGVLKLDRFKQVVDFKEKPKHPFSNLVAMCLYYFPKESLAFIRRYLKENKDKKDALGFYIEWLSKKDKVYGFSFSKSWYDIGHHKIYQEAKEKYERR